MMCRWQFQVAIGDSVPKLFPFGTSQQHCRNGNKYRSCPVTKTRFQQYCNHVLVVRLGVRVKGRELRVRWDHLQTG
jgi:hypothetical protein